MKIPPGILGGKRDLAFSQRNEHIDRRLRNCYRVRRICVGIDDNVIFIVVYQQAAQLEAIAKNQLDALALVLVQELFSKSRHL